MDGDPTPSKKSPAIEAFLESNFGRTTAITSSRCVPPPVGCGKVVTFEVDPDGLMVRGKWGNTWFRDEKSLAEYRISGLCQTCQDEVFGAEEY